MQATSTIDWSTLKPLVAENVSLKLGIMSLSGLPLHQIASKVSRKEIVILFRTGCITDRIIFEIKPGQCHFTAGATQFLMTLLRREIVSPDAGLLVYPPESCPMLKPIFYEFKGTLDYLCKCKLANPDVADSEGCPVILDAWREDEHFSLVRVHKLLTCGAEAVGTDRDGNNLLHLLAVGKYTSLLNVLRYFPGRENLRKLASTPNNAGCLPLQLLITPVPYLEVLDFLLELGADVNARAEPRGLTILHTLVTQSFNLAEDRLYLSLQHLPGLKILPDYTGVTPLDLALHHGMKATVGVMLDRLDLCVNDVLSKHTIVMPHNSHLSHFDHKGNRAILLLRAKHGVKSGTVHLPDTLDTLRPDTIVDKGLTLTMDNVKAFSNSTSPWFLEFYHTQMESLLINFVNKNLCPETLTHFLHSYLETLNSDFNVKQNTKKCDFNFQLSKHLTRIVRAVGHLRTVGPIDELMDKFLMFLSKKLLPLIDKKLKPASIMAVKSGYIQHFIQDVIFQINIVFSIWYFQTDGVSERVRAREMIEAVWHRLQMSPNVELSLLGNCVAAIVAWRVMICAEIKLDPNTILHFFKEMGADLNERSGPDKLTPLAWIVTYDCGRKFSRALLREICELGGYVYACNRNGDDVITIAANNSSVSAYRKWGENHKLTPKPLKTICAQFIVNKRLPLGSVSRINHLMKFIRLHDLSDRIVYVFKSGEICVSERQMFYLQ